MLSQWREIERQRSKIAAICQVAYQNGKDPDLYLGGKEEKKATKEQMKKNAAAFF